ncbi:hypothetical protein BDZ88DRAFT_420523 [Geranomyces variabilis]|nr:hypothetical protein BDZ88DRAFT_420523 [Geranomyces variabilis]KAJ3139007.1 hypothetical protein HDU90_000913 [Geranomyces variabilis]
MVAKNTANGTAAAVPTPLATVDVARSNSTGSRSSSPRKATPPPSGSAPHSHNLQQHQHSQQQQQPQQTPNIPNPSIMICRNKHYPYIASYHGPWLSLPVELLHSLFALNNDTTTAPPPSPIDPTIFRNLITIRTLVDDASEMVIKAAGGQNTRGSSNLNPLGIPYNSRETFSGSGRMSAIRQHRLRELAVSKLAAAYRCDEIATSVLTMQSASALDDVAAKVLKRDPQNADALYVHHFHEKIPSRMLASSTDCKTLDTLIASNPQMPEYYRTRAMIHSFREEFPAALKDFKTAIALAKKRKRNVDYCGDNASRSALLPIQQQQQQQPQVQFETEKEDACSEAGLYFLRAACFHQYAIHLIDKAIDKVNDTYLSEKRRKKNKKKKRSRAAAAAAAAFTASNGAESGDNDDPASADAAAVAAERPAGLTPPSVPSAEIPLPTWNDYRDAMTPSVQLVENLARRSIRDYHHFLSYYPNSLEPFGPAVQQPPAAAPAANGADETRLVAYRPEDPDHAAISTMPAFVSSITPRTPAPLSCAVAIAPVVTTDVVQPLCSHHHGANGVHKQGHALSQGGHSPRDMAAVDLERTVSRTMGPHGLTSAAAAAQHQTLYQQYQQNQANGETMTTLGTYHPLLLEAWFSIGVNYMLTRDWRTTAQWHDRTPFLQDQVEGYPVFLPARSMSQADYIEILTLLRKAARERAPSSSTTTAAAAAAKKAKRRAAAAAAAAAAADGGDNQQNGGGQLVTHAALGDKAMECACHSTLGGGKHGGPVQANGAGGKDTHPLPGTLKQYPLHTKRAQTVSMYLQAMSMPENGYGGGVEEPCVAKVNRVSKSKYL